MPDKTFEDFYKSLGLEDYPFGSFMAEKERKLLELFVKPTYYGPIVENFRNKSGMFLVGERGTGKTAVTLDLIRGASTANIVVLIDNFSDIEVNFSPVELYRIIINRVCEQLFYKIFNNRALIRNLDQSQRLFLSYIYKEYTTPSTKAELKKRLEQIQITLWQRGINLGYRLIRFPLNFLTTTAINIAGDAVSRALGNISPDISDAAVKEYFPDIALKSDKSFNHPKSSFNLLVKLTRLISELGLGSTIVVLDRLDEDSRLEGDAEKIANFVKGVITESSLHSSNDIQLIASIWSVPFRILQKNNIRLQKINVEFLSWNRTNLIAVLNKRLNVFSNGKITNFEVIFDGSIEEDKINLIFELSNGNPRDLWHAMNSIFRKQFEMDKQKNKISQHAIEEGLGNFATHFDYYEYYPRKANARNNSLDVYAFIRHLLKLPSADFTKNQLTERAGVSGGSASNYVAEMENIGLISSTGQTRGATEYSIRDPKIKFALQRKLEISRDVR